MKTKQKSAFDKWWDKEQGKRMKQSRYLARKAWNAAVEEAIFRCEFINPDSAYKLIDK